MKTSITLTLFCLFGSSQGFLQQFKNGGAAMKSFAEADEAVSIYDAKYPFDRPPLEKSSLTEFLSFGVPNTDVDGTQYKTYDRSATPGPRLTDISEKDARATFNELAKCYGAESALEMTKAQPLILTFKRDVFAASLKEYSAIFGEEEAKAMVGRNPGLLAVKPVEAAKATDQTMQASYLIAATRPFGDVLLPSILLLLLVPAFESVSGVPIRATLFSAITGAM